MSSLLSWVKRHYPAHSGEKNLMKGVSAIRGAQHVLCVAREWCQRQKDEEAIYPHTKGNSRPAIDLLEHLERYCDEGFKRERRL
jgi:uncharacterized damage-inducible protein DinB